MRVDNFGKRSLISLRPNVGVGRPDEFVAGHALAGSRHARQTKIGGVCENGGEQRIFVIATFARAQIGESGGEPGCPVRLVQDFGDAGTRQHAFEFAGECQGLRRGVRCRSCNMQLSITELDAIEFSLQQTGSKTLQSLVQLMSTCGEPFVGCCRQTQLLAIAGTAATGSR